MAIKLDLYRFLLVVLALPALLPAEPGHKLVVVLIDGLDARFLNDSSLPVKAPNLRKLVRAGAIANVVSVAPSETASANRSLLTGSPPDEHTLSSAVPTLADVALKSGLKVASVFWPVAAIPGFVFNFPQTRENLPGNGVEFDAVARQSAPAGVIDRIESMFPRFQKDLWDDSSSAAAATYILATAPPDLLIVHFTDVEAEQHSTGALGAYARDALENDDDLLGQIVAKVPKGTMVAIVSGHAVENANYMVRPRVLLKQSGQSGPVEVADGLIGTTDESVAGRIRKLVNDRRRHGIAREVPMAEVRERAPGHTAWVAAFDTLPNYVASNEDRGPALGPGSHLTVAGLWPTRPGYRSVFAISGEGIPPRKFREIDLLEIAPTLAEVLGVPLPQARMRSLWTALTR